ncbi:DUF3472 domain-containing protein [Bacteroidota bacterium]
MNKTLLLKVLLLAITTTSFVSTKRKKIAYNVTIPTKGNSWILVDDAVKSTFGLTGKGINNWSNEKDIMRTYFYMDTPGKISLGIKTKTNNSDSEIEVLFNGQKNKITISKPDFTDVFIGNFNIKEIGYHYIDIKGFKKNGNAFPDISAVLIQTQNSESIKFVKDSYHFGRRGPSDHLRFKTPEGVTNVEWFYSELQIPKDQDVIGSYFVANGFGEGYFGMQVNSPTERRILFSVWSPYKTDNPNEIPKEERIQLLKKGNDVITNKFGNEGSGGQSFKVFNWKSNINYKFLLGATPSNKGYTDYVAYFFDPEMDKWNLVAQFRRPKTITYLKRLYSFLENFIPNQGIIERRGLYQNQWVYNSSGWHEVTEAVFTADNTAKKNFRLDYSGGIESTGFYLQNCGFTNKNTPIGTEFKRKKLHVAPEIDFSLLD